MTRGVALLETLWQHSRISPTRSDWTAGAQAGAVEYKLQVQIKVIIIPRDLDAKPAEVMGVNGLWISAFHPVM